MKKTVERLPTANRLKHGSDVIEEVTAQPSEPYQDKYWWKGRQQYYDRDEMVLLEMERELCEED